MKRNITRQLRLCITNLAWKQDSFHSLNHETDLITCTHISNLEMFKYTEYQLPFCSWQTGSIVQWTEFKLSMDLIGLVGITNNVYKIFLASYLKSCSNKVTCLEYDDFLQQWQTFKTTWNLIIIATVSTTGWTHRTSYYLMLFPSIVPFVVICLVVMSKFSSLSHRLLWFIEH